MSIPIKHFLHALAAAAAMASTLQAEIVITELMADNTRTLPDSDGAYHDWIEIYNNGSSGVDLEGWALTDDALAPGKWVFPAVTLAARGHLVVWASNKNRRVPGQPLHTNFKLDAAGEYLALVRPDGTNSTTFSPFFPPQAEDLAYGYAVQVTTATPVQQGSAGRVLVPGDGSLGSTWTQPDFDDTAWPAAVNGIGYETGVNEVSSYDGNTLALDPAGYYRLEEGGVPLTAVNLGSAGSAANGSSTGSITAAVSGPRPADYAGMAADNKATDFSGGYLQVPWHPDLNPARFTVECWARVTGGSNTFRAAVSNRNDQNSLTYGFILYAAGDNRWQFWTGSGATGAWEPVVAPSPLILNEWTHVVGTYDGTTKRLYLNGTEVASRASTAFNRNTVQGLRIGAGANESPTAGFPFRGNLDEVAIYPRALTSAEISARWNLGENNTVPAATFFQGLISTDLQSRMHNVNATAYFRLPFTLTDPSALDQLTLKMKYDDGFQAWINGVPVASGNRPEVLQWNSAASGPGSNTEAVQFENFGVGSALAALRPGTNVLAIQGLNAGAANPDFLQLAQLEVKDIGRYSLNPGYLAEATPGSENASGTSNPGPSISSNSFAPALPDPLTDLTVTCRVQPVFAPVASVTMKWRTAYNAEQTMAMTDDGTAGDAIAGDGVYTAVIAKTNYTQGRMVRWFFTASDTGGASSRWPLYLDPLDSPQYAGTMIAPSGFTTALPVWYWFTQNTSAAATRAGTRASVYFNGQLYDNVFVRLRGGFTSSGSKKFDFNSGYHCGINARVGSVEEANLNGSGLGTADTIIRPAVAFEMFRRAGHPSSECFPVMIRVNGALDTASGRGGVAYFVEQVDKRYLERHGLDGNGALYKPDQRSNLEPVFTDATDGVEKKTRLTEDRSDYLALVNAVHSVTPDDWNSGSPNTAPVWPAGFLATRTTKMFDLMNLANLANYLACRVIISDTDDTRKNFYWYRDTEGSGEWHVLPWDKDGTLGLTLDAAPYVGHPFQGDYARRKINGSHQWNYVWEAAFNDPRIRPMILRRLRTFMDTLLGPVPGAPEALVDSIWAPVTATSPAFSGYGPTVQPASIKSFFAIRRTGPASTSTSAGLFTVYTAPNSLGSGIRIPDAQPALTPLDFGAVDVLPLSGNQDEEYVQLANPNPYEVDISGWELKRGVEHTFEPGTVIRANDVMYVAGKTAAFRARTTAPSGGQQLFVQGGFKGTLSARGEIVELWDPGNPANPTDDRLVNTLHTPVIPTPAQQSLRVTEIMYDPPAGGAFAAGEYEYLELSNTGATPLTISGANFTEGISFTFGTLILAPGQRVLLVKNEAAFQSRYGNGLTIAGSYTGSLDNSGERIRLVDSSGEEVLDFRYEGTWHPLVHGSASLVISDPAAAWDTWGTQSAWNASAANGSPGTADPALVAAKILTVSGTLVQLQGTPGRSYRLLQSSDLKTWSEVSWHPAGADGAFTVTLPAQTAGPPQFFIWETH
ncbi:MAG: lamin tail domain-containing protein [Verrucomicrobiota bacterium]